MEKKLSTKSSKEVSVVDRSSIDTGEDNGVEMLIEIIQTVSEVWLSFRENAE